MTTTRYQSAVEAPGCAHPAGRPTSEDLEMIERTREARELLSSKWKVDLLYLLARGVRRYSRLYDNLRGASKKMLTDSLRSLERDGLVDRHVYAEVPVRVEYSLTGLGWSATELLMALADWADEHMLGVEQARSQYDRGRPASAGGPDAPVVAARHGMGEAGSAAHLHESGFAGSST
jgi:DNA-binding HxlR family transcriptional regulator